MEHPCILLPLDLHERMHSSHQIDEEANLNLQRERLAPSLYLALRLGRMSLGSLFHEFGFTTSLTLYFSIDPSVCV